MVLGSIDLASAPPALADANPPPGYHTVTVEKAGVSFVVPDTWTKLDPTSPLFADTMKQATDANPDLAALFEGFDPSQLTFFAIDSKGTFFASNVLVNPTMLDKSNLSDPPNRIKSQLNLGPTFQDVQVHRTKVGRSRAITITGSTPVNAPDGSQSVAHMTDLVVASKKGVIEVTFTSGTDPDETVQTMIRSLKILQ